MRTLSLTVFALVLALALPAQSPPTDTLDIYWIDVEGGAATLVVTPYQETVLMDAGWAHPDNRDAHRILAAMRDANVDRIDYFIASHFHTDHTGGLPALAAAVEIGEYLDHGETAEPDRENSAAAFAAYTQTAGATRRTIRPGDRLRLEGLQLLFLTAHGRVRDAVARRPNPLCDTAAPVEPDEGENSRSVGYLLSLGGFQFLNLGDLTVNVQHELACPNNRVGAVDIYQIPHHGDGVAPELTWAVAPTVAVINNGPAKGGGAEGYQVVARTPGLEDLWQVHRRLGNATVDAADEALTANLTDEDDCEGHWIKAVVHPDGRSYTVTNARTGHSRSYFSR